MQKRGQCKCGEVLTFDEGPDGFKRRCPKCGAVVRLRVEDSTFELPAPVAGGAPGRAPPRPSDPRLSVANLRAPGPAVPGAPDPDATTPFEPIAEAAFKTPLKKPSAPAPPPPPPRPPFLRRYGLALALTGALAAAVAAGLWWRLG